MFSFQCWMCQGTKKIYYDVHNIYMREVALSSGASYINLIQTDIQTFATAVSKLKL